MGNLEDIPWNNEDQYEVLGSRFKVRFDDEPVAEWVARLLKPFRTTAAESVISGNTFALASSRPGDARHHAYRDTKRIGRSESWTDVLDLFLGELNRRAVDAMDYFGVHAGVVASGDRTMTMPGDSGAGKTTLVAACLQAGLEYVSDEALCVDYSTREIVPYPKPLSLSGWSLKTLGVEELAVDPVRPGIKAPIEPEALGGVTATGARVLTDLVVLERRAGVAQVRQLASSEVVANLLRYSFNHYKRPVDAFQLTSELAKNCQVWGLAYDDPKEAAAVLRSVISR